MTVKELKDLIAAMPDETRVYVEIDAEDGFSIRDPEPPIWNPVNHTLIWSISL